MFSPPGSKTSEFELNLCEQKWRGASVSQPNPCPGDRHRNPVSDLFSVTCTYEARNGDCITLDSLLLKLRYRIDSWSRDATCTFRRCLFYGVLVVFAETLTQLQIQILAWTEVWRVEWCLGTWRVVLTGFLRRRSGFNSKCTNLTFYSSGLHSSSSEPVIWIKWHVHEPTVMCFGE